VAESIASDLKSPGVQTQPLDNFLSVREFQVFCKIASGATVSEIVPELNLSVKTVNAFRIRVVERMAVSTNADLTAYALRNGLIQ
jgi:two-component system invasion response regulator UvrY